MTRSVVVVLALASVAGCAPGVYAPEADEDAEAIAKARDTGWEDPHEERSDAPNGNNGNGNGNGNNADEVVETAAIVAPAALIVPPVAEWTYLDHGTGACQTPSSATWKSDLAFDDSTWDVGPAELGYGDGDEETVIGFGSSSSRKCISYYFRHEFTVDDPDLFDALVVRLLRDDGAVVYLNGQEVVRSNMPSTAIGPFTRASSTTDGEEEDTFFEFDVANNLVAGSNLLAVEVHQRSGGSSDVSFNLALEGVLATPDTGDPTQSTDNFTGDDATIQESTPNANFGTRSTCKMDGAAGETNSGLDQSCLMVWDVSSIPDGATVLAAHVQVEVTNTSTDRYPVYPLLQEWVESTVTWNDRNGAATGDWFLAGALDPGTLGTEPADGDRSDAVTVVNGLDEGLLLLTLPPDLVQFWVDNDDLNFGAIFADRDNRNGMDFATAETTSPPTLVVTYQDPPVQ